MKQNSKKPTAFAFVVLCPIFLVFSLLLSQWHNARRQDFSQYWQGGAMILSGKNVYDSAQWVAEHQLEDTAFHTEPTFQYPLPLAIFYSLLALLPIQTAYIVWMFFAQVAVLTSIIVLLSFYPARSGYLELLAITGIFFFRPMFTVIDSGQIATLLLLMVVITVRLFRGHKWFLGGFVLSILCLKPSVGFPILALAGLWFLSGKQWKGLWGMICGGLVFVLIGALVNYHWVIDYISVGGYSFQKYYGMQPTLWGVVDKIFKINSVSMAIGFLCVVAVFAVEAYLFWRKKPNIDAFPAFASILPAALLVAPYSWHHDQILLVVPIVFLLIKISVTYGTGRAALFMLGIVALAFGLVTLAYQLGHDVWSFMNSLVVWILALYFAVKTNPLPGEQTT